MRIDPLKPREIRQFGSSHALAWRMLPPATFFVLFGAAVLVATTSVFVGSALVCIGGGLLALIAARLAGASVAAIAVSAEGIVFTDVSPRIIPWREVRAVEIGHVREVSNPVSRRVVSISVSHAFFSSLSRKTLWPQEVVSIGDPTVIHIAYYRRDVPVDELAGLIASLRSPAGL